MLERYLSNPTIRIVICVLLGLGLASLFRGTCHGDRCIVVRAPDPDEVEGKVFRYDSGCYQFQAKMVSCPKDM